MLLVQLLVLAFTGFVWWLARRDLGARPAPPVPATAQADARELEQLCVTLEALVTDLAARMEAVEQRLRERVGAPLAAPSPVPMSSPVPSAASSPVPVSGPVPDPTVIPASLMPPALSDAPPREVAPSGIAPTAVPAPMPSFAASTLLPSFPAPSQEPSEPEIAAHAPLYALLEAGITDPAEITRRTGLGRGEVDLILSLRARRAI